MKTCVLAASVLTLLLLSFAYASTPKTPSAADSIRAVVTDYIESYYTADAARMERSLHPHYLKHTISGSGESLRMTETTGLQIVQEVRNGLPVAPSLRGEQITVLDVNGDIASAKLVTPGWVDYVTLSQWNGRWKIVSVVLREN